MSSASSSSNYIKRFWALAIPACLAGLLQPLASFSDIVVLGRQSSTNVVAAVGLSANYFDIAYLSFGFCEWGQLLGFHIGWPSAISRRTGNSWSSHSRLRSVRRSVSGVLTL